MMEGVVEVKPNNYHTVYIPGTCHSMVWRNGIEEPDILQKREKPDKTM